jgi:hypothetical protein
MKNVLKASLLVTIVLIVTLPNSFALSLLPTSGIMTVEGHQLPDLLGTPESNVRFAMWNGTLWIELPFSVKEAKVQSMGKLERNGTTTTSVVSEAHYQIMEKDVISVRIPTEVGLQATLGEWWLMALHLELQNRLSIQVSNGAGYTNLIYVYYQKTGACPPPDYGTDEYAESLPANGTVTSGSHSTFDLASAPVIFKVKGFSSPQIAKLVTASHDPPVYSLDNIMTQKFEGTGDTPQPTRPFYLPAQGQATSGVILRIEGTSWGDPYLRVLNAYVNGQKVWYDHNGQGLWVGHTFSAAADVTNKIQWWGQNPGGFIVNNAGVVLTCYSGYGYWDIRAFIYVVYNANSNFRTTVSNFAQWYQFDTNNLNIVNYTAQMPESIANEANSVVITIHGKAYSDIYARYLDLYLDNQMVKRWTVYTETIPPYPTCILDITSYVLGKCGVKVGIQLICGVGHWIIDGNITVKYRPSVAPDGSSYWSGEIHTLTDRAGNIYDSSLNYNTWGGMFAVDTRGQEMSTESSSWLYTGATVNVPSSAGSSYTIYSMETHITATHAYQGLVPASNYNYVAYGGSSSGSTQAQDIGSDLLALLAAGLAIPAPELAVLVGVASILVKYITPPSPGFDYGPENGNGVFFKLNNPFSGISQKSILFKYQINWPWVGQYTVKLQTTLTIGFRFHYFNSIVGTISFTNTFTHNYNP